MGYVRPYSGTINLSSFVEGTIDPDTTMSANSDGVIPTQKAVKTMVNGKDKVSSYIATADNTTSFPLGLPYDNTKDKLVLTYQGVTLDVTNFTISSGTVSLTDWSIANGDIIDIEVKYNVR